MASKAPRIGDVVKSRVTTESLAGFIVAKEGIHVWVRFFDTALEGESWDVFTRRDTLEVLSRANAS
jgi:hypothetical protein